MKRFLILGCLMTFLFAFESFGQEPIPIGDGAKKPAESSSRGGNHNCYATIYFYNTGCKKVEVYYRNGYGNLKHFGSMQEKNKWGVYTYPGDKWIFKVDNHQVYTWTVPRCYNKTINIDSKGCYGGGGHQEREYCSSYDHNCDYLHCTYKKDYNKYQITGKYNGDYQVSHWTINGQKKSNTNKSYTWTTSNYGTYEVCTYYWCSGQVYKCCKEIVIDGGHGGGHDDGYGHCNYEAWYTYPNKQNYKRGSRVYVKVDARNYNHIKWMKLYVNGRAIRTESNYPYEWGKSGGSDHYLYNMKPGHYKCKVEIRDNCGKTDYKYHEFWVKDGY